MNGGESLSTPAQLVRSLDRESWRRDARATNGAPVHVRTPALPSRLFRELAPRFEILIVASLRIFFLLLPTEE